MTEQQLQEDFRRRRTAMDAAETAPVLRRPYMVRRPPNEEFLRRRAAMDEAETVPVLKRARTQEEMDEDAAVAFLASRTYAGKHSIEEFDEIDSKPPWEHLKKAKGRELSRKNIPSKFKHLFDDAQVKEWSTWVKYTAARPLEKGETVTEKDNVMDMRFMWTDKLETERGMKTWDELPPVAKARIVIQGPKDKGLYDGTAGNTSSPTLPEDGLMFFLQVCITNGWRPQQGDIEAAFLNGGALNRKLILRAPPEGLPEIPGVMPAIKPGGYLVALKSIYGMNQAPHDFNERHAKVMVEHGAVESRMADRTLFYWLDSSGVLEGIVATHVDDDLFGGTEEWKRRVLPNIRRSFCYNKWKDGQGRSCTQAG